MRDSTIIYRSFYEAIATLSKNNRAEVWDAVFEYALNFKEVELTGHSKAIFLLIKPQLDANNKRFLNGSKPKAKDKQEGSETEAKPKQDLSKTEANANENLNENENNNNNVNDKGKPKAVAFAPPTQNEVEDYFLGIGLDKKYKIESQKFIDFYTSKGWMVGKNKMKDWKAACNNWKRSMDGFGQNSNTKPEPQSVKYELLD